MKRLICLVLCLYLLIPLASATKKTQLEFDLENFMSEHDLTEKNFALSYYNPISGERYQFNEDNFFPAGRLWTLPLHMYFYEQEKLGAYEPPVEDPLWVFKINNMTLEDCRYHSIILDKEEVSLAMRKSLGSLQNYLTMINERYGLIEEELLSETYFDGYHYSAKFLMNCARELGSHPEQYGTLMQNFSLVQTADALAGYSHTYPVVQIRGEADGMVCALAEVTAPQNYYVVAFVTQAAGGDAVLAELNDLLCDYVEESSGIAPATEPADVKPGRSESDYAVNSSSSKNNDMIVQWLLIAFGSAIAVFLIVVVIIKLCRRRRLP